MQIEMWKEYSKIIRSITSQYHTVYNSVVKTSNFKILKLCQDEDFFNKRSNQQITPQVFFWHGFVE